MQNAAGIEG